MARPRARLACTKGCVAASLIDRACTRSSVAARGKASASTGTGRCRMRSASQAVPRMSAEVIPPTGAHPRNRRQIDQSKRRDERGDREHDQRRHPGRLRRPGTGHAGVPAQRDADPGGHHEGHDGEDRRIDRALADQVGDRPLVDRGASQIEPGHTGQPSPVLLEQRPIQAEQRTPVGDLLGAEPEAVVDRAARSEVGQHQGDRRDRQREETGTDRTARDEPRQGRHVATVWPPAGPRPSCRRSTAAAAW